MGDSSNLWYLSYGHSKWPANLGSATTFAPNLCCSWLSWTPHKHFLHMFFSYTDRQSHGAIIYSMESPKYCKIRPTDTNESAWAFFKGTFLHLFISLDGLFCGICIDPYILGPYNYFWCIRSHAKWWQSVFLVISSVSSGTGKMALPSQWVATLFRGGCVV